MGLKVRKIEKPSSAPGNADEFYLNLTNRNFHFVSPKAQENLKKLKVLVAGCGSGGGACAEPLVRLGVYHMRLADSGSYELTNYNRQRGYVENIGQNKAEFVLSGLKRVNPFADFEATADGITPGNVHALVEWADVIWDCVDVTARSSLLMKIKLHECAQALRKPVFVPMDLGFCQTGISFDYRDPRTRALGGRAEAALDAENPIKALLTFFPLQRFPGHSLRLVEDALLKKPYPISQLACASDLLSSVAAAAMIRFAENGELVKSWHLNLEGLAIPFWSTIKHRLNAPWRRRRLKKILGNIR